MIDKFIKINTANAGPILINATDVYSVINTGSNVQINTSNNHRYTIESVPFANGTHSILQLTSGTTTADGTGSYPPQLIDSSASFDSIGILPGDKITNQATPPQQLDNLSSYDQLSNIIVSPTTLQTQNIGLGAGVDYAIYSSNKINDPSADFVSLGVQVGWTLAVTDGYTNTINCSITEVTTNTLTIETNGGYLAQWNEQILFDRANDPSNYNPITYSIYSPSDYSLQTAINAAIADVVNNTTSHVVELPIVVPGIKVKNT